MPFCPKCDDGLLCHCPVHKDIGKTRAAKAARPSVRARLTQRLARQCCKENTVTDVARLCNVSRQTVHAWLRGQPAHGRNLEALAALARVALPDRKHQRALIDALTGKRMNPED